MDVGEDHGAPSDMASRLQTHGTAEPGLRRRRSPRRWRTRRCRRDSGRTRRRGGAHACPRPCRRPRAEAARAGAVGSGRRRGRAEPESGPAAQERWAPRPADSTIATITESETPAYRSSARAAEAQVEPRLGLLDHRDHGAVAEARPSASGRRRRSLRTARRRPPGRSAPRRGLGQTGAWRHRSREAGRQSRRDSKERVQLSSASPRRKAPDSSDRGFERERTSLTKGQSAVHRLAGSVRPGEGHWRRAQRCRPMTGAVSATRQRRRVRLRTGAPPRAPATAPSAHGRRDRRPSRAAPATQAARVGIATRPRVRPPRGRPQPTRATRGSPAVRSARRRARPSRRGRLRAGAPAGARVPGRRAR